MVDASSEEKEVIFPYNPRHLQDAQEILEKQQKKAFDARERAFYETLSPEQKKEHDAYKASVQRIKTSLNITSPENHPPESLLAELSKQQQKIISLLWKGAVTFKKFTDGIWPTPTNPETHTKSINRLNARLIELNKNIMVTRKGDYIILEQPDNL